MPDSPYKFLDHYGMPDRSIFFGREKETRILLSDIVVNRLVVLFAKTGTGKTSIINAGVRPRLEERGYETFFIRVRKDPVESARAELKLRFGDLREGGDSFPQWIEGIAASLQRPILLCFDQFEEFFVHSFAAGAGNGRQFIADVADLFHNRDSGVHLLFSMREEWFVWMDEFRDDIPSIFHNESNLRLRWFDEKQAKEAIQMPAQQFQAEVDSDLADHIVAALMTEKGVEPAQLQIVCHRLWQGRSGPRLTLADYRRLGLEEAGKAVAASILYDGLAGEFEKIESREELDLLVRLLPLLRTPREPYTKYVRDMPGLVEQLETSEQVLGNLIDRLEAFGFIRKSLRDKLVVVELTHDYLIDHFDELARRIRAVWPRKILAAAQKADREATAEEIAIISGDEQLLKLSRQETEFLFRSTLEAGHGMSLWFRRAEAAGVDARTILKQRLRAPEQPPAYSGLRLLAELGGTDAVNLLRETLDDPRLASSAVEALTDIQSVEAVQVLSQALQRKDLRAQAEVALRWMTASPSAAARQAAENALARPEPPRGSPVPEFPPMAQPAPARSFTADIKAPVEAIASQLAKGQIIPFLGPGVAFVGRPPNERWRPGGSFLPSHMELAEFLAKESNFPLESAERGLDLAAVTSFIAATLGRKYLDDLLRDAMPPSQPNSLHRYLAKLPSAGIIMTTAYDDAMERALDEAGRPYHVVAPANEPGHGSTVHWWRPGASRPEAVASRRLLIDDSAEVPVIYKIQGTFRQGAESVLITEDDHVDLAVHMARRDVPPQIIMQMRTARLLFLGYGLRDWYLRILLRTLSAGLDRGWEDSWAITYHPSQLDVELWRSRRVKIYDARLDEFVQALAQQTGAEFS